MKSLIRFALTFALLPCAVASAEMNGNLRVGVGRAVVAAMKTMPTDDPLFGKDTIRGDGRKIHPMYLLQVKTPAESNGEWDVFKVVGTIPADKAFHPLNEGDWPLVKK